MVAATADAETETETATIANGGPTVDWASVEFGSGETAVRGDQLIGQLADTGLSRSGLEGLDRQSMQHLVNLLSSGQLHAAVTQRIFNGVAETNSRRVREVVEILEKYTGSWPILNDFLNKVGCDDPFIAAETAQVLTLPAKDIPGTAQIAPDDADARVVANDEVLGASGQVHKGMIYCAYRQDAPAGSVGYFSKKQAITKIMSAFNPSRFGQDSDQRTRVRDRRSNRLREALQDLTVADLEEDSSLIGELGSALCARNMAVYQALRDAIQECRTQLGDMVYGQDIVISGVKALRVSAEHGRQFFGWFEDHIKENPGVPQGIITAFENLRDPDLHLSTPEEKDYFKGLLAYQRVHTFINKDVALGGLVSDLEEHDALHSEDDLRLDEKVAACRDRIRAAAATADGDMSISEFSTFLELSGMTDFRRAMNQRCVDTYGGDFEKAVQHFGFVSFKPDNTWREDAYQDSVPMGRLKAHLYGTPIGIKESHHSADEKKAVLGQRDFAHIMRAQFLQGMAADQSRFLTSYPIKNFRSMVEGVVLAYRKAVHLDGLLADANRTVDNPAEVGETLSDWCPVIFTGTQYKLAEELIVQGRQKGEPALDAREIVTREQSRSFGDSGYRQRREKIEREVPAGLFTKNLDWTLQQAQRSALKYQPADDTVRAHQAAAKVVTSNPLVTVIELGGAKLAEYNYLLQSEREQLARIAEVQASMPAVPPELQSELDPIKERMRPYGFSTVYTGTVETRWNEGRTFSWRVLQLRAAPFREYADQQKVGTTAAYYDAATLKEKLDALDTEYVKLAELPAEWFTRVKYFCSRSAKADLHSQNFGIVDDPTFRLTRTIQRRQDMYISRAFVDQVNTLAEACGK